MKMRLELKNRSQINNMHRPRNKYIKYKMYFTIMVVICVKDTINPS